MHVSSRLLCVGKQRQQTGGALIIFFLVVVLASTSFLFSSLTGSNVRNEQKKQTAEVLAEAKAALIGYAITYDDTHSGELFGYLPCPDTSATDPNGEGSQSICGNLGVSVLGRLPWKTLKASPLKDGYGECLWYAVSGSYKNNPKTGGLSRDTSGFLEVLAAEGGSYLTDPEDPAVAVVFAPGPPLVGQSRVGDGNAMYCGGNYVAYNYLDKDVHTSVHNATVSSVPNAKSTFIAALNSSHTASDEDSFNDRLIIIKRSEIFASYCKKYANTLLTLMADAKNGFISNGSQETITQASDNLQNYCAAQECKDAAQTLLTPQCSTDITAEDCQGTIDDLKACNG